MNSEQIHKAAKTEISRKLYEKYPYMRWKARTKYYIIIIVICCEGL